MQAGRNGPPRAAPSAPDLVAFPSMAGRQQPGFIERTVDELDEATDVRDFDNDDHIEGWALHKHEYIKRYQLSTCKLLRAPRAR